VEIALVASQPAIMVEAAVAAVVPMGNINHSLVLDAVACLVIVITPCKFLLHGNIKYENFLFAPNLILIHKHLSGESRRISNFIEKNNRRRLFFLP